MLPFKIKAISIRAPQNASNVTAIMAITLDARERASLMVANQNGQLKCCASTRRGSQGK